MPEDSNAKKEENSQSSKNIEIPPIPKKTAGAVAGAAAGSIAGPIRRGLLGNALAVAASGSNITPSRLFAANATKPKQPSNSNIHRRFQLFGMNRQQGARGECASHRLRH